MRAMTIFAKNLVISGLFLASMAIAGCFPVGMPDDPTPASRPQLTSPKANPKPKPRPIIKPPEKLIRELAIPTKATSPFLSHESFVTNWLIYGPFSIKTDSIKRFTRPALLGRDFIGGEGRLRHAGMAPAGTPWREIQFDTDQPGMAGSEAAGLKTFPSCSYAVIWLDCPKALTGVSLQIGNDEPVAVWLNGRRVFTYSGPRRQAKWDQATASDLTLKAGQNILAIKCLDMGKGWKFYLRLADSKNRQICLPEED